MTVISMMSAINQLLSPINLFSTYVFWCGEIDLDARALSLSFFSVNFMIACPCEVLNSFLRFAGRHEFIKISFISFQRVTKNFFVSSSFLSDLSFCTLIKDVQFFLRQLIVAFLNLNSCHKGGRDC